MDNLGIWRTFPKVDDELILTSSTPATVVKELSTMAIFLLLGHGEYVERHLVSGWYDW